MRIIRESSSFLKKQEPEMNPSEQAVYEKIAPILSTRPAFGLKLLKAMAVQPSEGDDKPSPAFEFMMGNAYNAAGQYEASEAKYRSVVDRSPTFVRAWNNLGVLYYTNDRYAEAVPCFSKSVTLGDHDPTTFGLLGNSFEKSGNTVSAEMAYKQALASDPANINWTEGLLRIYFADKEYAKAETLVRSLLAEHPREAKYWMTYVNLMQSCDRKIEATALLQRVGEMGLAREEDIGLLADLYADQHLTPEALATYGKVALSQPLLAEQKLLQFAKTLISERNFGDASSVLEALSKTQLSPHGRVSYMEAKVDLEIARKDWIAAKSELEGLIKVAPSDGNAWLGLGRVYQAETEQAKAIEAFEHAYQIQESSYRASVELANIEFKNHRYERCVGYLEHALSIQRSPAIENFRNQIKNLIPPEKQSIP